MPNNPDPLFIARDGLVVRGGELVHVRGDGGVITNGDCHDPACHACDQTRGYGVPWVPRMCIHNGRPAIDVVEIKAGLPPIAPASTARYVSTTLIGPRAGRCALPDRVLLAGLERIAVPEAKQLLTSRDPHAARWWRADRRFVPELDNHPLWWLGTRRSLPAPVTVCEHCGRWNYHLRTCPLFGRS